MLLSKEETKQQTRNLWKDCFNDTDDFLDIYFEDKYTDERNLTVRQDGRVIAAMQLLPYRFTFYGSVLHAGYISGLCVQPEFRRSGKASQLIREAHRELFRQGGTLSFLIPGSESLRQFYEKPEHGAFWTSTFRKDVVLNDNGSEDARIEIRRPDYWADDLYVYYKRNLKGDFVFRPSPEDFYAALSTCDLENGYILVAYRKRRVAGLCLAVPETGQVVRVRSILADGEVVRNMLLRHLKTLSGATQVRVRMPSPGALKGVEPYAMARVVSVPKFLGAVLRACPDFQIHIGVDGDLDIPENNGYYIIENGRLGVTDSKPDSIITPGGLAAMFLGAHPTNVEMMLDE